MGFREQIIKNMSSILGVSQTTTTTSSTTSAVPSSLGQPGNQGDVNLPNDWATSTFAPGWPIRPVTRPQEAELPREIDYPIAVNATLQPRSGYGLMPFDALASAYNTISEIQMCVHLITRGLQGFQPRLVDGSGEVIADHPYDWICHSPDRRSPWGVWLSRFMQSSLIFDAGSLVIRASEDRQLKSIDYVDGSTLFVWVDEFGRMPAATPVEVKGKMVVPPAFTQVIKGTPYAWYNQDQIYYRPFARRYNSPYGTSPIEEVWSWILIVANITGFELSHYRSGNLPEGLLTAPLDWTVDQVAGFEEALNTRMSVGGSERMRVRVVPGGFSYTQTKGAEFPAVLYDRARDNISLAYGIPPSEWGKMPGQGLGGAGFNDMMASSLYRNVYGPRKSYVEEAINTILDRFGITDARLELASSTESTDPQKFQQGVLDLFRSGMITLNDALGQLGRDPIGSPGDVRIVISGNTIFKLDSRMSAEVISGSPKPSESIPEPAPVTEPGTAHEERQLAEKILDTRELPRTASYSFPSTGRTTSSTPSVQKALSHPKSPNNQHFAPKAGHQFDMSQARTLGNDLGVEWSSTDIAEFLDGLNDEMEHLNSIGGNIDTLAALVLDHLREDPKYYSRLRTLYKSSEGVPIVKHCGVCPEDDEYFGSPITNEADLPFPSDDHANTVDVIALTPGDLPSRSGLWKPEGGELDVLRERVGGPLYVREEAAYLLDRSLHAHLVPVSYVADYQDERGAVIMYVSGNQPSENVRDYDPVWVELAACIDYIACQLDRHSGNWLTHPDDPKRPILIDNGLSFPETDVDDASPFADAYRLTSGCLGDETLFRLKLCSGDASTWADILSLVGESACSLARNRLSQVLELQCIPQLKEK